MCRDSMSPATSFGLAGNCWCKEHIQLGALMWHVRRSWVGFPSTAISFSYDKIFLEGLVTCVWDRAGSICSVCSAGINTGTWPLESLVQQLAPYRDAHEYIPGQVCWRNVAIITAHNPALAQLKLNQVMYWVSGWMASHGLQLVYFRMTWANNYFNNTVVTWTVFHLVWCTCLQYFILT